MSTESRDRRRDRARRLRARRWRCSPAAASRPTDGRAEPRRPRRRARGALRRCRSPCAPTAPLAVFALGSDGERVRSHALDYPTGPPVGADGRALLRSALGTDVGRGRRDGLTAIVVACFFARARRCRRLRLADESPVVPALLGAPRLGRRLGRSATASACAASGSRTSRSARRAEREAERERRLAAAEERTRIARDLHDSAGHAINVILVQAGAARLLAENDPARSREALETIETVARETLGEIDRLVQRAARGRGARSRRRSGSPRSTRSWSATATPGSRSTSRSRATGAGSAAGGRPGRLPDRAGGADERAPARRPDAAEVALAYGDDGARDPGRRTRRATPTARAAATGIVGHARARGRCSAAASRPEPRTASSASARALPYGGGHRRDRPASASCSSTTTT